MLVGTAMTRVRSVTNASPLDPPLNWFHRHTGSSHEVELAEHELGTLLKIAPNPIHPAQCVRDERDRLNNSFVGLGATESQEAAAGFTEALTAQAGDTEGVVGPFQQVERKAVRCDPQAIAA